MVFLRSDCVETLLLNSRGSQYVFFGGVGFFVIVNIPPFCKILGAHSDYNSN